jgi:hypothetical protein
VADIVAVRAGPLTLESFITMAKGRPLVERSWSRSSAAMMMKLGECRLRPRLWCEGVCVCVCVWQWLQAGRKGDFKQGKGRWVGWRFVVGQRPGPSNGADARGATMGWSAGLGGE